MSLVPSEAAANEPKDRSLGLLGNLPAELRLNILEIALETDRHLTVRRCCGILGHSSEPCKFHASIEENNHTLNHRRFALLFVSRGVYYDALWDMNNKMRVHADVTRLMLIHKPAIPYRTRRFRSMWARISQFRIVDLFVPSAGIHFDQPEVCITSMLDCVTMLFDKWATQNSHKSSSTTREMTIHLGAIFNTYRPFRAPRLDNPKIREEHARLLAGCWRDLPNSVGLISSRGAVTDWSFSIDSEIDADNLVGEATLKMLKKLLEGASITCKDTPGDVPTMESRSATGGIHRRFLD